MNVIVVAKPLERLEIIYTENGKGKPFGFQFVITKLAMISVLYKQIWAQYYQFRTQLMEKIMNSK